MGVQNLFTLLTERLLLNASHVSMATYNTLFELLIEHIGTIPNPKSIKSFPSSEKTIVYTRRPVPSNTEWRFENATMLKVLANLITQSEQCDELVEVRRAFVDDIIVLCERSRDNRR